MAVYLIGDIQGCHAEFMQLLEKIDFSPSRDTLYVLGDLVNRGDNSLAVLRHLMQLDNAAQCILGNHDLHLLATSQGIRKMNRRDTLDEILNAPDKDILLDWLRQQPLSRYENDILMVHAGVLPNWTIQETLSVSNEIEQILKSSDWIFFLKKIYEKTNEPFLLQKNKSKDKNKNQNKNKSKETDDVDYFRLNLNVLTRLRYVTLKGEIDFECTQSPDQAPKDLLPWFELPNRETQKNTIAFGHWSTLGLMNRPHLLALDTGCVWGGFLTACCIESDGARTLIQVPSQNGKTPD